MTYGIRAIAVGVIFYRSAGLDPMSSFLYHLVWTYGLHWLFRTSDRVFICVSIAWSLWIDRTERSRRGYAITIPGKKPRNKRSHGQFYAYQRTECPG